MVARGGRCKVGLKCGISAISGPFGAILQRPPRATMAARDGVLGLVFRVDELTAAQRPPVQCNHPC